MEKLSQVPWKWELEMGGNISDMGGNKDQHRLMKAMDVDTIIHKYKLKMNKFNYFLTLSPSKLNLINYLIHKHNVLVIYLHYLPCLKCSLPSEIHISIKFWVVLDLI